MTHVGDVVRAVVTIKQELSKPRLATPLHVYVLVTYLLSYLGTYLFTRLLTRYILQPLLYKLSKIVLI